MAEAKQSVGRNRICLPMIDAEVYDIVYNASAGDDSKGD